MTYPHTNSHPDRCNGRGGQNERPEEHSPTTLPTNTEKHNPTQPVPRCPRCGCVAVIPREADRGDDISLVKCIGDGCGRRALPSVYREWGAIAQWATSGPWSFGSWGDGTLTIRLGGRTVARIGAAERTATVDPDEGRLADILSTLDLDVCRVGVST